MYFTLLFKKKKEFMSVVDNMIRKILVLGMFGLFIYVLDWVRLSYIAYGYFIVYY